MNCRDVREAADSFVSEELPTGINHEMLRHLESCPTCRAEIDARGRLRVALRDAFNRAPNLQPSLEFERRLRHQLGKVSAHGDRRLSLSRRWLALAASIVIAAAVGAGVLGQRTGGPAEALARDAVGDHRNCALKYRHPRMPVPLEEAAQKFDSAYRVLRNAPPDRISTPDGVARVTERHSCAYAARRFGHVIIEYRGRVVSLLVTANDGEGADVGRDTIARAVGRPLDGLTVVSVSGTHHAILLVSDLNSAELTQLSTTISLPLARRLEVSLAQDQGSVALLHEVPDEFGQSLTTWVNRFERSAYGRKVRD